MENSYEWELAETGIDNIAKMVSAYYLSLIEHGLDKDFAESLTIEYQACWLEIIQNKAINN